MRSLVARLRSSRAVAFYRRLDGTSEQDGMPWLTTFGAAHGGAEPEAGGGDIVVCEIVGTATRGSEARDGPDAPDAPAEPEAEPDAEVVGDPLTDDAAAPPALATIDADLVPALNRVAEAFERMAASFEMEHQQREARLVALERLLHELVTGLDQPTAAPPRVVGGSIDLEAHRRAEIDLAEPQLDLADRDDAPHEPA